MPENPVIKKIKIGTETYDIVVDKNWEQNDTDKPDYLQNRPFYTDNSGNVHQLDAKYIPVDGSTITVDNNKLKAEIPSYDLQVGKSNTKENEATENQSTYLKLLKNDAIESAHLIKGAGGTKVSSDNTGNITITTDLSEYAKAEDATLVKFIDEGGTESALDTLEIYTQTQEQYEEKLEGGTLKDNAMYLTPFVLENSLNSDSTTVALTAAAGKRLNDNKAEKTDVYTKQEINALLDEVEGGSTESASSVKRALDTYIQSMDAEVFGTEKVTEWRESGTYSPDYSVNSRIDDLSNSIPSKTSDLVNDSDFATTTEVQEHLPGFAYYSAEAEKASGYLGGGEIDRMFRAYKEQVNSLKAKIDALQVTVTSNYTVLQNTINSLSSTVNNLSIRIGDWEDDGKNNSSNSESGGGGIII